jgi:hypothetical protein
VRNLFRRKSLSIILAVVALSGWTAWYMTQGAYRDLPHGECVVRQPRYLLSTDGATRTAVLSTSFWLDAKRIHMSGCYRHEEERLSIDRSASIDTLFARDGTILSRVRKIAYSRLDNAASQPVPGALVATGDVVNLRFKKLTPKAWIVETDDNRAGMCLTGP